MGDLTRGNQVDTGEVARYIAIQHNLRRHRGQNLLPGKHLTTTIKKQGTPLFDARMVNVVVRIRIMTTGRFKLFVLMKLILQYRYIV